MGTAPADVKHPFGVSVWHRHAAHTAPHAAVPPAGGHGVCRAPQGTQRETRFYRDVLEQLTTLGEGEPPPPWTPSPHLDSDALEGGEAPPPFHGQQQHEMDDQSSSWGMARCNVCNFVRKPSTGRGPHQAPEDKEEPPAPVVLTAPLPLCSSPGPF